jgi:hypothetical protein
MAALRADRDKAMVLAGLRCCDVPALRVADVRVGDRPLFWPRARASVPGTGSRTMN